ncbi:Energy-coupling factor transporter transmembrane protein EcfT [Weissella viridescens]|uniref:Energy-coupling factor transporter transmembrane protein EcfT n=1 Tax=Weissella viridescens TaxID=1629 RepID=A0A380NXK8_WEIVI|nr:Energy-coupling factor transporter transmembrane protein EcfT [Weissella viridescens]
MNKLILGRYLPGDSWVHRLDARTKFILSMVFIFVISWRTMFSVIYLRQHLSD